MPDKSFSPGILWWLFLALFSPLVAVGAFHVVTEALDSYQSYLWFAVGILLFVIFDRFIIRGKDDTIRIFSHELNHAVVSLMLFKKVHSFHVEQSGGVVYHTSGGRLPSVLINLAPYCLPLFSYVFLIARGAMKPTLFWVVDILIGITIGFYVSVFRQQTRSYQPDISQYRHRLFPYWYIFTFLLFNASIIIYSLLPGKNVFMAFADIFVGYWHSIEQLLNL